MRKYGAANVSMSDISRISVLNSMNTCYLGNQIHLVKEEYPGVKFVKQEDIGPNNLCTYRRLCRIHPIFFVTFVVQLVMKRKIIELIIFFMK